jgi:hypothetical protein
VAARGARWEHASELRRRKLRWKTGAVDEGEHHGAFYSGGEERRQWPVSLGIHGVSFNLGGGEPMG